MRPSLAFPYNDPSGTMFPHLLAILPDLKAHFEHAYIAPPPSTLAWLRPTSQILADEFFTVFPIQEERQIGEHFAAVYRGAAEAAPADQAIHLCYPDRLAFALEGTYRAALLADIDSLTPADLPLIFHRSPRAWATHPQNYRDLEGLVTITGKHLFGRELDYAWCHLVMPAGQLREVMSKVKNLDLSIVAEMIFYLQPHIQTREVDWLAWEDPFIFGRDSAELKAEREASPAETQKRLRYIVPMLETLTRLAQNGGHN